MMTGDLFSLKGKNAWITGGAHGIGFSIACAYAAAGADWIVFNCSNEASRQKGLDAYHAAGIENVRGYVCDVTDEKAVHALVEQIHAEVGPIHILVNNAGIIKRIPMHEMKRAEFQQVIDVDVRAGPRDRIGLCRRKRGPEDAYPEHLLGIRFLQYPVQRSGTGLYRHLADRAPARAPARWQPPSV